jgi:hypothetical protein
MSELTEIGLAVEYQKAVRTLMSTPSVLPSMNAIVGELAARDPFLFNIIIEHLIHEEPALTEKAAEALAGRRGFGSQTNEPVRADDDDMEIKP